jgi:hypothetical protein
MRFMMLVRSVAPRDRRLHRSEKRWAEWQLNPRNAETARRRRVRRQTVEHWAREGRIPLINIFGIGNSALPNWKSGWSLM